MSYNIHIIDTQSSDHITEIERAIRKSVKLKWLGGDSKDELVVVGSELSFTMVDQNAEDGRFSDLFTGNETRYKCRFFNDDDVTIWVGHLLPDRYNEPYKRGFVDVSFSASCGLGRLRGKVLPDAFYETEHSVIDIFAQILSLTGLDLPLYFAPAIENSQVKNYKNIYLAGWEFKTKKRKKDAHAILQQILKDMLCRVYQCDNRWYIDGINKQQQISVDYKVYNLNGDFLQDATVTRLLKESKGIGKPLIRTIAPLGQITVIHKREPIKLPETIAEESNDGWAVVVGVIGEIYASDWNGNGDYFALAKAPDYEIALPVIFGESTDVLDAAKYVDLKEKIYVGAGDKMMFSLKLEPSKSPIYAPSTEAYFENGTTVQMLLNGQVINEALVQFDNDEFENEVVVDFDVVPEESGLLDVRIYQPWCDGGDAVFPNPQSPYISEFFIKDLTLERVEFEDEMVVVEDANDEFTLKKEITLKFADDASGYSAAFRLAKLNEPSGGMASVNVPILYGIEPVPSEFYSVVSLKGANLIADNINTVFYNDLDMQQHVLLNNLEVVYNFNGGEEMVVKTEMPLNTSNFQVNIHDVNNILGDRSHWEQWTDAIYEIETERYAQIVANILRRMFNVAHYAIDMDVDQSLKFNDILTHPYKEIQNYFISNLTWHIDVGQSQCTAIKGYYLNDVVVNPDDNIPPIVETYDVSLPADGNSVNLTAIANDPDGEIVSVLWEQLTGYAAIIDTPFQLNTALFGLTGNDYTFKITVTDNDGATASAIANVNRVLEYDFSESVMCTSEPTFGVGLGSYVIRRRVLAINIAPVLPVGTTVNVTVKLTVFTIVANSNTDAGDYVGEGCDELGVEDATPNIKIAKNGVIIYTHGSAAPYTETVNFTMIAGTDLKVQLENITPGLNLCSKCEVLSVTDVNGNAMFTGLPFEVNSYDQFIPL